MPDRQTWIVHDDQPLIPGLTYQRDYIDPATENLLLMTIDTGDWSEELKRRVQQFGAWRFHTAAGDVEKLASPVPMPEMLLEIARQVGREKMKGVLPEHVIVNEYLPGQGIGPHVDKPCFGETVCSLSLGSAALMDFHRAATQKQIARSLLLEPRSLLTLEGEARRDWAHGIRGVKGDEILPGKREPRGRRVSITFRTITEAVKRRR